MRGFQPGKARAVPQNYADGGVVSTIKGMLGFGKKKPEPLPADLNKMPPPAAGQAASQPEPPKKAISEYSGMSALERRMKAAGLADGGLVRGPGTGISDDIEDEVPEGTFIMPADSTEAVGPETMDQLGQAEVPVNLSNGEAKLPPEALQAIGAQVMEAIKDVTHVPAAKQARGFPMGERAGPELDADDGRMNFADGGVVDDKRRPRTVADLARSPGYGAGAGGPVSTPVRTQAPAARPQAAQPVPGVTRQGNSYSAAPVQGPLGSGMYQLDSNLPKPPNIQAQAQRPAAAPAQRPPAPAPVQAVQQPVQNPVQPRPVYTGSTVADRARQPGFGFAAGASTPAPSAQAAKVAPAAPVSQPAAPAAAPATLQAAGPAYPSNPDMPTSSTDGVGKAFGAIGDGLAWLGKTAVSAPGYGFSSGDKQQVLPPAAASQRPGATTSTPAEGTSTAEGGRGFINPARVNPSSPPPRSPAPTPSEISPGIFRQASSFGDSPQAAAAGAIPSQGPSARNMEAMNNLIARDPVAGAMDRALGVERDPAQAATGFSQGGARQAPAAAPASAAASSAAPAATTARGFQPAGQSAQPGGSPMEMYARQAEAMRGLTEAQRALDQYGPGMSGGGDLALGGRASAQQFQQDMQRTALMKQAAQGGRGGAAAMQALNNMDGNQIQRETAQMREQGDTARFNAREAGETTRAGMRGQAEARRDGITAELGRGQLDLQRSAQGFTTRQAARQEKLYEELDAAKTPEEQAAVSRKIAAAAGKTTDPKDNFMVVGGGQEWDAAAGAMRNVPQRLVDLRTVQDVGATGQGGKPLPAPADPKERKVGTVYVAPNGANVRWTGQGWQQA